MVDILGTVCDESPIWADISQITSPGRAARPAELLYSARPSCVHVLRALVRTPGAERHAGEQLGLVPLDLRDHPPRPVPHLGLVEEVMMPDDRPPRRAAHRTGQKRLDLPLQNLEAEGYRYAIRLPTNAWAA